MAFALERAMPGAVSHLEAAVIPVVTATPRLSIVMPCLNEAETLATCIRKARNALSELDFPCEIIIADNGSTDGSQAIARSGGARVVEISEKGYGCALRGGIAAARGEWIIMGDADDSYDFRQHRAVRGKTARRLRVGHGLPAAFRQGRDQERRDAMEAPLDRQSGAHFSRPLIFQKCGARFPLRTSSVPQGRR